MPDLSQPAAQEQQAADGPPAGGGDAVAQASGLVVSLGRALHAFGTPSHRLELALGALCARLGLSGQFFSTPTAIFASFGDGDAARTVLVRAEQGETNLEKLARLEELLADLSTGAVDVPAASREVDAILTEQPRYRGRLVVAAAPLSCASATVFFGGGWREVLATLALSSVLVALARLLAPRPNSGRLVELLSAALAAVAAGGCAALPAPWGPIAPSVLLLASMLPLVPGLSLTVAMSELANRHLVSGSARLAGALTTFVMLGFGVALGQRIAAQLVAATPAVAAVPLAAWTTFPALLATSLAFLVLFQAPPRDYRWVLAGVALAVFAGQLGAELFGRELGAFAGALAVGLGSNLVGRLLGRPGAITQLPGLMVLVPGSLGFRSVNALLAEDVLSGVQTAFSMVLVAVALVTGLLTANVLLPSRRPL